MPTIKRFSNCKIAVYAGDHDPAHFHIVAVDFDVMVEIETLQVIRGNASKVREAMAWAIDNLNVIRAEWERCNGR